jgi:hypothetical protein
MGTAAQQPLMEELLARLAELRARCLASQARYNELEARARVVVAEAEARLGRPSALPEPSRSTPRETRAHARDSGILSDAVLDYTVAPGVRAEALAPDWHSSPPHAHAATKSGRLLRAARRGF